MATFIVLLDYTDKGVRDIKDSPHRADTFNEFAEKAGARVVAQYWTLGTHDGVLVLEAPNDEVAHKVSMISRATGAVSAVSWPAVKYDRYLELVAEVERETG